jgi:farnesyl diphosphate synthase
MTKMGVTDDGLFVRALTETAGAMNDTLEQLIAAVPGPEGRVVEAMRYAALDGGKRLRPFLVCASSDLFHVPRTRALRAAAAMEMVHCYSLVHDDLPAMDDDDLRRGRPTVHKAFDEATAILAGDGLLTLAFEVLADPATHPDGAIRAELVTELAKGAGAAGMVGGQMIDLRAPHLDLDEAGLIRLQGMKTGCLIASSCRFGAILGGGDRQAKEALGAYGKAIGLAFQIADDVLDVESSAAETGKATGKDAAAGKATFVSRLGLEGAKTQAQVLVEQAIDHVGVFGPAAEPLRQAAKFTIRRRT